MLAWGYSLSFCSFGHLPIKISHINKSSLCETLVRSNYLQRVLNTTHDASSFYVAIMRVRGRELETQGREGGREGRRVWARYIERQGEGEGGREGEEREKREF